jgi:hypothetical protein
VPVALEQGAAAGAVHHHVVGGRLRQGRQVEPRQRLGGGTVARVLVQGAAAPLPVGHYDAISVDLEGTPGGVVDVTEEGVHDTATKQRDRGGRGGGSGGRLR